MKKSSVTIIFVAVLLFLAIIVMKKTPHDSLNLMEEKFEKGDNYIYEVQDDYGKLTVEYKDEIFYIDDDVLSLEFTYDKAKDKVNYNCKKNCLTVEDLKPLINDYLSYPVYQYKMIKDEFLKSSGLKLHDKRSTFMLKSTENDKETPIITLGKKGNYITKDCSNCENKYVSKFIFMD